MRMGVTTEFAGGCEEENVLQCVAVCSRETLYLCLLHMRVTSESAGGCEGERASPV